MGRPAVTQAGPRASAVYDSDARLPPLLAEMTNVWQFRGLLKLLVTRDITLRYKRSMLGVWWTILNPLLTCAVMYIIFSAVFRFQIPGNVPYVVYLLSGVLLVGFFSQGVITVGNSLVSSANILTKVYVPPEVFAVSAAVAATVNFLLSVLPLLVLQVVLGVGIPWTILLVPLPVVAMLALIAGLGLLVATAAIRFNDVLDLTAVIVLLLGYLTPSFYPIEIVPDGFRPAVEANPLFSYLEVFRGLIYGGELAPFWNWAVMIGTSVVFLALGTYVFSRRWRSLAVML